MIDAFNTGEAAGGTFMGDQLAVSISGRTGPQITSLQDLSLALDSDLQVIPA